MHPDTKRAIAAIGDNLCGDYVLKPQEHAVHMEADAGPLQRVLGRPKLLKIIKDYGYHDNAAGKAQTTYRWLRAMTIWSSVAAIIIGAFFSAFPPSSFGVAPRTEFALLLAIFAVLIVSTGISLLQDPAKWQQKWMEHRAEAEQMRKRLFEQVFREDEPAREGEIPALPLKLEYFRRYQLDVQKSYLEGRSGQHDATATKATWARRFTDWLPFLAAGGLVLMAWAPLAEVQPTSALFQHITSYLQGWREVDMARLLLFSVVAGAAVSAGWIAQSLVNNNARNALRYRNTLQNLAAQETFGLEKAREDAVSDGEDSEQEVRHFIWAIHQLMGAELQEWTVLTEPLDMLRRKQARPSADQSPPQ